LTTSLNRFIISIEAQGHGPERRETKMATAVATEKITRIIFKCSRCKTVRAFDYLGTTGSIYRVTPGTRGIFKDNTLPQEDERCTCGRVAKWNTVNGHFSPSHKCDSRCEGATGPACECSCGGANHGGRYIG